MKNIYIDKNGVSHQWEITNVPASLDPLSAFATLLCVVGIVDPNDAANVLGLTVQDLVSEAQAWAVAQSLEAEG